MEKTNLEELSRLRVNISWNRKDHSDSMIPGTDWEKCYAFKWIQWNECTEDVQSENAQEKCFWHSGWDTCSQTSFRKIFIAGTRSFKCTITPEGTEAPHRPTQC